MTKEIKAVRFCGNMSKQSGASESQILRSILDWLAAKHVLAFRMNTATSFHKYKGKTRKVSSGVPGMADIVAFPQWITVHRGLMDKRISIFWIEVKSATGKQSKLQRASKSRSSAKDTGMRLFGA